MNDSGIVRSKKMYKHHKESIEILKKFALSMEISQRYLVVLLQKEGSEKIQISM